MISDRWKIGAELERYIHPLNEQHPGVYNVCSCQVAPDTVNVQDALVIGSEQSKRFSASLSSDFHATTKKKVKSMEAINVNVKVKVMVMYFAENCQYQDEVQWAHWNHNQVTIHPISTYYTCSYILYLQFSNIDSSADICEGKVAGLSSAISRLGGGCNLVTEDVVASLSSLPAPRQGTAVGNRWGTSTHVFNWRKVEQDVSGIENYITFQHQMKSVLLWGISRGYLIQTSFR